MTQENPADVAHPRKRKDLRLTKWILGIALVFLAVTFIMVVPMMVASADRDAIIKIPKSATFQTVADSLTKYLGKSYADKVIRLNRLHNADFSQRHGAYLIPKGMNAFMAARRLHRGAQNPVRITINGFRSLPLMASRIAAKTDFTAGELESVLTDSATLAGFGLSPDQALALFLDDTYEIYWTTTPGELVEKIGAHYRNVWTPTRRRKAADMGLTPAEAAIIASIVDEESNKEEEKGTIGRLYVNRLQRGMKLQADPTVRFALNDFTIRRVTSAHLHADSPYNTYLHAGLPPAPIRTSSVKTIDAVLDSKPSDYIYMCAKEDFSGFHNFASNYRDHVANALRYQHELDKRGIK